MNKNIKKYSGLSMVMGTVLVLSGCGHVKSMKEDNLSNKVEVVDVVDVVDKKVNSTTTVLTTSVVTTTTSTSTTVEFENNIESASEVTEEVEPFAYAGSRYEDNVESEKCNS